MSDLRRSSGGTSPSALRAPSFEKMYMMCVSGSNDPPCQFAPPVATGSISVRERAFGHLLTTGGVKIGPIL